MSLAAADSMRLPRFRRIIMLGATLFFAALRPTFATTDDPNAAQFRIEEPGTITFTTGVKIVGKVEKPEVVIFLPKEKSYLRELPLDHSFKSDLLKPLQSTPHPSGTTDYSR